ncbi:acyl-CoA synthase [Fulvimarina pelagi HTCC2506]|uniref:Acyl-CoA synthase n=1 Tax=Fulvimarina pelagi HTCC2506 TaxID=314231 RepID=Q0G362_9HYPH|nr:AMP-binding protein [Fulvimarina pelagi]EAU41969.1 acyl-CoA synthase [Fulvimarina pelagi HTCC2506]
MIRFDDRRLDAGELFSLASQMRTEGRLGADLARAHALRLADPAEMIAAFLLIRAEGGSVMPLHASTPEPAARRVALAAGCESLTFGRGPATTLEPKTRRPAGDHSLIQTSSGTTGEAKIIARSFADIETEIASYTDFFAAARDLTPVVACPVSHSYGLICGLLAGLVRGAEPLVIAPDNPKYVLAKLTEIERPVLYAAPALLHVAARFLKPGETIHAAMTSGTVLPAPWFETIRARTGLLFQQYGCSEAGVVALNQDLRETQAMGRPLPHLKVEAGTPEKPAPILVETASGTVDTQDLGHFAPDGTLNFDARLDDTIIVSGLNVYPREVEDVALTMPGVADAVVFGLDDHLAGGRVVLLFDGAKSVEETELAAWCGERLAAHQRPREIRRVSEIPRGPTGKISRREVRARVLSENL